MTSTMACSPCVPARRLRDWQPRLAALIAQRMQHPLVWGRHDCCLFAADAVLAVTGADVAVDLRGTYSTAEGADQLLQRLGGLAELCIERLGPVIRTALAAPGDVGIAQVAGVRGLVVCGGAHWLAVGPHSLQPLPSDIVLRAWRCTRPAAGVAHG